jgi:hypothetical protein
VSSSGVAGYDELLRQAWIYNADLKDHNAVLRGTIRDEGIYP